MQYFSVAAQRAVSEVHRRRTQGAVDGGETEHYPPTSVPWQRGGQLSDPDIVQSGKGIDAIFCLLDHNIYQP